MIMPLLNPIAGVSKATLATHLADDLSGDNGGVVLMDDDPRAHALRGSRQRCAIGYPSPFHVVPASRRCVREGTQERVPLAAHVPIDAPLRHSPIIQLALMRADGELVPLSPACF